MSGHEKQSIYLDAARDVMSENPQSPQGELVLGKLSSISEAGQAVVTYSLGSRTETLPAIATIELHAQHIGRQVGLLFSKSPEQTPVIVGLIHNPLYNILDAIEIAEVNDDQAVFDSPNPISSSDKSPLGDQTVAVDGKKVVIEGEDEIVLKCGEASITLNKNGKISIRGKYLLNRSSGVNRIMGGSVQVN